MNKGGKVLLGLATLWPFFYLILFFVFILSMVLLESGGGGDGAPPIIAIIFPLHLLTMLIIAALTVFYIVNVFRNNRVDKDKKALWAIVIFMGSVIAMPIYWYLYVWKEEPAAASAPGQLGSADSSAWTNEVRTQHSQTEQYVPPSQPPNWRE
jgi:hypothetical protein